ncbi:MAG: hypothetical protein LH624_17175, partial [Cryobacterium sp.]|nr:hypothetical protein [Cryobacterium sp.]
PFTRFTLPVVIAAYLGLIVVLSVPLATDFLQLQLPPLELMGVAIGASAAASVVLEVLFRLTRR